MGQYKGGSAFYRVLHGVPVCAVIGAIIRGRGLPTALLPLVTQADEQPALQDLVENVQIARVYSSKLKKTFQVEGDRSSTKGFLENIYEDMEICYNDLISLYPHLQERIGFKRAIASLSTEKNFPIHPQGRIHCISLVVEVLSNPVKLCEFHG